MEMKTNNMIRRFISILLPAAFVVAGCAQDELLPEDDRPVEVLATKCVNSVERAADGTLLLYLEEDAALKLSQGETVPEWEQVCSEYGIEYVEKLFPKTDDELSRKYGLHRWYMVSFSEDATPCAWLPALAHTIPYFNVSESIDLILLYAPLILYERTIWRSSLLRKTSASYFAERSALRWNGVGSSISFNTSDACSMSSTDGRYLSVLMVISCLSCLGYYMNANLVF